MNPLKTNCPNCKKERKLFVIQEGLKCPDCDAEVVRFQIKVKKNIPMVKRS